MSSSVEVHSLSSAREPAYRQLVRQADDGMFTHTLGYRDLLTEVLDAEASYLIAIQGDEVVGALPAFIAQNDEFGPVLNSLPFFGSPGGVILDPELADQTRRAVVDKLIDALQANAAENGCLTSTIVTSQFDSENGGGGNDRYEPRLATAYRQDRIAQVLELPQRPNLSTDDGPPETTPARAADAETVDELLFSLYERRTRRAVRKPYKEGLTMRSSDDFGPLYEMHREGMEAKGGTVKPRAFFEGIDDYLDDDAYALDYVYHDGSPIAGLLLFLHGDTVEYFTPAYDYDHRELQATSLLIHEGLKRAMQQGRRYWNFGGTRDDQDSLYRFKRGWGADDWPYHYYTVQHDGADALLEASREALIDSYPWFYSVPFHELTS